MMDPGTFQDMSFPLESTDLDSNPEKEISISLVMSKRTLRSDSIKLTSF